MKQTYLIVNLFLVLFIMTFLTSCIGQEESRLSEESQRINKSLFDLNIPEEPQIAEYIRHILQDKKGNLWLGTNGYGVAHYDGDSLYYFSNEQGFHGHQITGIVEDLEQNIWFATDQGIVKYDWESNKEGRKQFTNFTDHQYFNGQRFWSIFADSKSNIWAGSVSGIYRFDDEKWDTFELPFPEEVTGEFITRGTSWSISEDKSGNIWFSTNGFGAFKYDGKSFTQYSKKDGLTGDSVDIIIEDSKGNMWFGTRHGGLSRYDGTTFTNYTSRDSIGNNEVCVIYEDKAGNIWFCSEGYGVYRFDGKSFTNYSQNQGLEVRAVQTIFEDREGRLWVGGGGGLYRYDLSAENAGGKAFFNVTKNGPWK